MSLRDVLAESQARAQEELVRRFQVVVFGGKPGQTMAVSRARNSRKESPNRILKVEVMRNMLDSFKSYKPLSTEAARVVQKKLLEPEGIVEHLVDGPWLHLLLRYHRRREVVAYAQFIMLKIFKNDGNTMLSMSPGPVVEAVWKTHMQFPQEYLGMTMAFTHLRWTETRGNKIPVFAYRSVGTERTTETYEKTLKVYKQVYGIYRNFSLWPAERKDSVPAPKNERLELSVADVVGRSTLSEEARRLATDMTSTKSQFTALLNEVAAKAAVVEYARFLLIKALEKDVDLPGKLAPSEPVRAVWEQHMQLPYHYAAACFSLLGANRVIAHDVSAKWQVESRNRQYAAMRSAYARVFGTVPNPVWWPAESGDEQPAVFLALPENKLRLPLTNVLTVNDVLRASLPRPDAQSVNDLYLRHLDDRFSSSDAPLVSLIPTERLVGSTLYAENSRDLRLFDTLGNEIRVPYNPDVQISQLKDAVRKNTETSSESLFLEIGGRVLGKIGAEPYEGVDRDTKRLSDFTPTIGPGTKIRFVFFTKKDKFTAGTFQHYALRGDPELPKRQRQDYESGYLVPSSDEEPEAEASLTEAEVLGPATRDPRLADAVRRMVAGPWFAELLASFPRVRVVEYARFVLLKFLQDDVELKNKLSPSGPVDAIWQAHVLLPQDYAAMCFAVFGKDRVMPRSPTAAEDANRGDRYAATLAAYRSLFGREDVVTWSSGIATTKVG